MVPKFLVASCLRDYFDVFGNKVGKNVDGRVEISAAVVSEVEYISLCTSRSLYIINNGDELLVCVVVER